MLDESNAGDAKIVRGENGFEGLSATQDADCLQIES